MTGLRGPNVITTLTPPHRFTAAALTDLRTRIPAEIAALPGPRVAVLLGGPGAGYVYDDATIQRFAAIIGRVAALAGSLLITPSRRTPPALLAAVDAATKANPRILWRGEGENPYPDFLANADLFVVPADSVNMAGEACATGKPVYVFTPPGGRGKFHRFHAALQAHGATRPLDEPPLALDAWSYEPLTLRRAGRGRNRGAVANFPVDNVKPLTSKGLSARSTFLTSAVGQSSWESEAACRCATKG